MSQHLQQKKLTKEDLGELHEREIDLIFLWRTEFRFGKIEIEMRDGVPEYLCKTIKRRRLGKL